MDRDMLIQYVDIINKMESIPYDVRMSHNDLDYSIIHFIEEQASTDEELKAILMDLKSMSCEDRVAYVKDYLNHREASSEQSEEGEIAEIFGIDIQDIQHLFLENGSEIFAFYDSHSGQDVVLGNEKHGESLTEKLEAMQKENVKYQEEDEAENAHSMLIDEAKHHHLTIPFYNKQELYQHPQELNSLRADDKTKINYLLARYDELQIVGINIEHMIYMDSDGNIHEAVLTPERKVQIVKPASYNQYHSENEEKNTDEVENSDELEGMLEDSYSIEENESLDKKNHSSHKQKVLVKKDSSDDDYGFTDNAFYLFLILFGLLFLIFIFLFIFVL